MTIAIVDDFRQDQLEIAGFTERFLQEQGGPPPQFSFYASGEAFMEDFSPHLFDIVLLDCCMRGMDGLETAGRLRRQDEDTALIFITSCSDYAVGGYLVSASGYLLKPYTYEEFTQVLGAAYNRLPGRREVVTIPYGNQTKKILVDDIVYCEIDGHYVQIHLCRHQVLRVRMTFSAFSALLAPYPQFLECYRGCMINMAHTHKAEALNFLMDTGERVPLRKKEQGRILRIYSEYLFDKVRLESQ